MTNRENILTVMGCGALLAYVAAWLAGWAVVIFVVLHFVLKAW